MIGVYSMTSRRRPDSYPRRCPRKTSNITESVFLVHFQGFHQKVPPHHSSDLFQYRAIPQSLRPLDPSGQSPVFVF